MGVFITGDTHGKFQRITDFCEKFKTTNNDVLIILGDAGINYWSNKTDIRLKKRLAQLPITLFCIHGNHERRPEKMEAYKDIPWWGDIALYEEEYPNLIFARDGSLYDIEGNTTFVCGGAYSADKYYRLERGNLWFPDEQPHEKTKKLCEKKLASVNWHVDRVLTHTCPKRYVPMEAFIPAIDQGTVDTSTEEWLDHIFSKLSFERWLCGHYHINKSIDNITFLFEDIIPW